MKTIFLALLGLFSVQSSLHSQTLRWSLDPGVLPTGSVIATLTQHQVFSNAQGTLGLVLRYTTQIVSDLDEPAYFVVWVNQRGKLIKKVEFFNDPQARDVNILHVTDKMLLIKLSTLTGTILRKYQVRANGSITESDTVLSAGDSVLFGDNSVNRDTQGFFIFSRNETGALTGIRRYTLR